MNRSVANKLNKASATRAKKIVKRTSALLHSGAVDPVSAYLRATFGRLRRLQAEGQTSAERKAGIIGCPPNLVTQCLAQLHQ